MLKMIASGFVFLFTIGSGICLSKLGKPYGTIIFNIHKLIALGFIIYTFIIGRNLFKSIDINNIMWFLIVVSIISVIALIATGGILSIKDRIKDSWVIIHKVSTALLLVSLSSYFYLSLR